MTSWDVSLEYCIRAAVLLVVLYVAYELLPRRKSDFVISIRSDRVKFKGGFPLAQRATIIQFLLSDAAIRGPCRIYGARKKRRLVLWFTGHISEGEKQRVRNFLAVGL